MNEHTFNKLVEMFRPILERNEYYASEKREKYGDRERENRGVTENFEGLAPFVFVNPSLLGFSIICCGTAVQLECPEKIPFESPRHIV